MQAALVPLARSIGYRLGRDPFASGPHALVFGEPFSFYSPPSTQNPIS